MVSAGAAFSKSGVIHIGIPEWLDVPFIIIGSILIILGALLWCKAFFSSKIDSAILQGRLVTSGAYSIVRNPLYTAIALILSGIVFLLKDAWLLFLPPFFFILMAVVLKRTEEVWLKEKFGKEYEEYCKKVPRCLPRPWKRKS